MRDKQTLAGSAPGGCKWPFAPVTVGRRLRVLIAPRGAAVTAVGATGYEISRTEMHAPACWALAETEA